MELHENARFFIGLDIDSLPISVGAGGDVPTIAMWENGKPRALEKLPNGIASISRQEFESCISDQAAS